MDNRDRKIECGNYRNILSETIDKLQCQINNTLTNPQNGFGMTPIQPNQIYGSTASNGTYFPYVILSPTLSISESPAPVDASDVLKFACMVGKRMLIKSMISYSESITEIKIVEFAPSYDYVKIQFPTGCCDWKESVKYLKVENKILEILDIEDKEGKKDAVPKL
jgi:hypothetical protein